MNWNEIFSYHDGKLLWKQPGKARVIGKPVGNLDSNGYLLVAMKGKRYRVHRIIYEMHNGTIPEGYQIDHINRVRDDNRIENLRLATLAENNRNTGAKGYSWHSKAKKWSAQIGVNGKKKHLGLYETKEEAASAYSAARSKYYGDFA